MFSASESREEVDHSFFDSDVENEDWKKTESKAESARPPDDFPPDLWNTEKLGEIEDRRGEGRQVQTITEESNSVSTPHKVINNNCGGNVPSTKSTLRLMAFLAKESTVNGTSSSSSTESEEEKNPNQSFNRRNKRSPKKLVRRPRQPSPSSSSSEADLKSDSSPSSSRNYSNKPTKMNKTTAGLRKLNLKKGDCRDPDTDVSWDLVTDVSPLSSPCVSPVQPEDQKQEEIKDQGFKEAQQQECVPSSVLSDAHHEAESRLDDNESFFSSECQFQDQLLFRLPRPNTRKNFSFNNDEVRRIDRENQRLLQELCRNSPRPRSGGSAGQRPQFRIAAANARPSHSALNRQREQKRIERENLAFLKRLEAVKPTRGLKRSEQLANYQRRGGYGGPVPPNFGYAYMDKEDFDSSRMWLANRGQRVNSASPQDASPASVDTSSAESACKSKKVGTSRPLPAWP